MPWHTASPKKIEYLGVVKWRSHELRNRYSIFALPPISSIIYGSADRTLNLICPNYRCFWV